MLYAHNIFLYKLNGLRYCVKLTNPAVLKRLCTYLPKPIIVKNGSTFDYLHMNIKLWPHMKCKYQIPLDYSEN